MVGNLTQGDKERFEVVRERAKNLGVLDINFSPTASFDSLASYERTLDIIEKNKEIFDRNAGESEM